MPSEKELATLHLQSPATQRLLRFQWDMETEEDKAFRYGDPIANRNAKTDEERVGMRELGLQEAIVFAGLREARGRYLAEIRQEPHLSSVDTAKRERAIDAYLEAKSTFEAFREMMAKHSQPTETYATVFKRELDKRNNEE